MSESRLDYAVIGHPVAHSLSPAIHAMFARQTGEALTYGRLEAPLDGFAVTAGDFFAAGGRGLNVTVPFKGQAAGWVHELDEEAAFAQAVNTMVTLPGGRFRGCNTDGRGLVADLLRHLSGDSLRGARVLVVGAGGAASGVVRPLAALAPAALVIANRSPARAEELAARLAREVPDLDTRACSLAALSGAFDVVINGTSAGLVGDVPEIPAATVRGALCYDMVYGGQTSFCRWALQAGASRVVDGLGMLVEQAALAFALWRGVTPQTAPVLAALRTQNPDNLDSR